MPAHFTHIYAARRVADYLRAGDVPEWPGLPVIAGRAFDVAYDPVTCGRIMQKWEKYAATGAIGPDLFYFSQDYGSKPLTKHSDEIMLALTVYFFYTSAKEDDWEPLLKILDDVNSTVGAIVRFVIKLEKLWHEFVSTWESTLGPLIGPAATALDDLSGGVLTAASDALEQLKVGLLNFVEQELLTYKDIFRMFDTSVNKGSDEKSMTWGDMVHYRRTSEIAKNLIGQAEAIRAGEAKTDAEIQARTDQYEQLLAFALGWLTHVGTDTIGHSFTNTQCGGPFRNHPQRHHLIENHMDAWNYRHATTTPPDPLAANVTYPDLTTSGLAFAVVIPEPGDPAHRPDEIPTDLSAAKAALRTDGELPTWMADAIVKALIETYAAVPDHREGASLDVAQDAADDERAQQDASLAAAAARDADLPQPAHPLVYGGKDFQATITGNLLISTILDVTGHSPTAPAQELIDLICPAPDFDVPHGFPLPWQVKTCYKIMLWYYNHFYTTDVWTLRKPQQPEPITFPPAQDFLNLLGGPDDSHGPTTKDSGFDVCDAIKAAIEWVTRMIDAAVKLIGDVIKMLASPASYPIRLALYELAMAVWDLTRKIHEIIVHTGFAVPHGEVRYAGGELMLGDEIDKQLITVGGSVDGAFRQALNDALDPMGNLDGKASLAPPRDPPGADSSYPRYMPAVYTTVNGSLTPVVGPGAMPGTDPEIETVEYHRPWAYPAQSVFRPNPNDPPHPAPKNVNDSEHYIGTPRELLFGADGITVVGPYQLGTKPDEVLFSTTDHGDAALRSAYEQAKGPVETEDLNRQNLTGARGNNSPLGSPVTLSSYLIGSILNNRVYGTQFNLDSDRAYGYLTWDWDRHHDLAAPPDPQRPGRVNPQYQTSDDQDRPYQLPLTPPQLTPRPTPQEPGRPTWEGPQGPLQLHYIDNEQS
ncbi:MAG: zinc dependent phospholipase C family protein [Actinomycetota bacterium]|nr:zinc dependent phospholipase C family protein [Actinomycetota bacterium]